MLYDFILVGSSFSSVGFLSSSNIKKYKGGVVFTDNQFKDVDDIKSEDELFDSHLLEEKTYFGQTNESFNTDEDKIKNLNIHGSLIYGGYSNLWGAYSIDYNKSELNDIGIENLKFNLTDKLITFNKNNYFPKKLVHIKSFKNKKFIASVNKNCVECGNCLYGCSYNFIYNTKENFEKYSKNITKFKGYKLIKIENKKNFIKIILKKGYLNKEVRTKKLIMGTGPLNTTKILLNSFNEISNIKIKDSQAFYIPVFSFKKLKDIDYELTSQSFELKSERIKYNFQVYKFGKYLNNEIMKQILKCNIFKILTKRMIMILGFLPSSESSEIKIQKLNGSFYAKIEKKYNKRRLLKIFFILIKKLIRDKLFLLPIIKIAKPLKSYHFGAITIETNNKIFIPNTSAGTFKIDFLNNIIFLDASILKKIPSGPISRIIMANAKKIGDNFSLQK